MPATKGSTLMAAAVAGLIGGATQGWGGVSAAQTAPPAAPVHAPPGSLAARGVIYPIEPPFNCVGDGVADDTRCFQEAITASQGKELFLGPHHYKISSNLHFSGPVHVRGVGAGWANAQPNTSSCLVAGAPNLLMFQLFTGSTLDNFCILAGAAGPNTEGYTVAVANASDVRITGLWIDRPCIGLDLNGAAVIVDKTYVSKVAGPGCVGMRVGRFTTGSATVDLRILNSTVQGDKAAPPDADLLVLDAGGLFLSHDDFLFGRVGTKIAPGPNQQVIWLFADSTALGDTTVGEGLWIDPSAPSAQIKGLNFSNAWAASSLTGDEVHLANTPGAVVTDINFTGARIYNMPRGSGVVIGPGVSNVSIGGASEICGYGRSGVALAPGAGGLSLVGARLSPTCAHLRATGTAAIEFGGSNAGVTVTSNDFSGNSALVRGVPAGASTFANNTPLEGVTATAPAAPVLALEAVAPTWTITGRGEVSRIEGGWAGRSVRLITRDGPVGFQPGGNICTRASSGGPNGIVEGWFDGRCWYLK